MRTVLISCGLLFGLAAVFPIVATGMGPTRESAIKQNPFRGLYDNIDHPAETSQSYSEKHTRFLYRYFMQENPKANPRQAELLAKLRGGTLGGSFPESEPAVLTPAKEPLDEIFRQINLLHKGKISNEELIRQLRILKLKYPSPCVTRGDLCQLIHGLSQGEQRERNWEIVRREWSRVAKEYTLKKEDYAFLYNLVSSSANRATWLELDEYFQTHPLDPWMRSMIAGRAAIGRAWNARGGGWASSVTPEGWEIFQKEFGKANIAFQEAIELEPELPQPHCRLIEVEMGIGSAGDCIAIFREAIRLQPDYTKAYDKLIWGLLPRWRGSHELIFQLAETAIATERNELGIPAIGVEIIGIIVWDSPDYRWKNWYRQPQIIDPVDRCYQYWLKREPGEGWTKFTLLQKMLYEMASLRYDRALETRKSIPLDDQALSAYWQENRWNGYTNVDAEVPRIPSYLDPVPLLKLFTGPHGAKLQALEREFLDGNSDAAPRKLAQQIRTWKLEPEEKSFLIDLYGHWRLPVGGSKYGNSEVLYDAFRAGMRTEGGSLVPREMIALGYDYSRNENYPGEAAILASRGDGDPELLDVLKKAGDPLNRPDRKYGRSPIQHACFHGKAEMARKLLALGCSPTEADKNKHAPIQFAATAGSAEIIRMLLDAGADPDVTDNDGDTALMFAIQTTQPQAVWEPLILASKKVGQVNRSGRSALHYAAEYGGSTKLAGLLIKHGADPKLRDSSGKTPGDIAREKGNTALEKMLK